MFSRFTTCSVYQYSIPVYGWVIFHCMASTTFCLYIYRLIHIWVVSTFWLFCMNHAAIIHVQMFSVLLSTYLGVELLSHVVSLCLNLLRKCQTFSKVAASFHLPTSSIWGFQLFHILANNTVYWTFVTVFLILAILLAVM